MLLSSYSSEYIEAGCDEAGRGCLAGPVFAAAVILPSANIHSDLVLLDDSKQLSEKLRLEFRRAIKKHALAYAVASVSSKEIDKINILNASFHAMHKALDKLATRPELLLIDGNRFKPYKSIPHKCIVKGDGKYLSIAAASILAKTYRDDYMKRLNKKFPYFGWNQNKGYATEYHREAIVKYGVCRHHRKSFKLMERQLALDI